MLYTLIHSEKFDRKRPIDDQLIARIADGDREALHALYDSASNAIYSYALSITKNTHDAEDVLGETIIKVFERAPEYVPHGKPMAWIFTICRNLSLDKHRQRARFAEFDETHPDSIDFSSVADAENRMLIETVFKILSDEEKQILMLYASRGLKHREIAQHLCLPLPTVLSKYHRAIKKLKKELKEE